jgi:hypothetical protein
MPNKQTSGARLVGFSEKQSSVTLLLFQLVQDNLYVLDILRINTLCEVRSDSGKLPSRRLFRYLGHRNFIGLNI